MQSPNRVLERRCPSRDGVARSRAAPSRRRARRATLSTTTRARSTGTGECSSCSTTSAAIQSALYVGRQ